MKKTIKRLLLGLSSLFIAFALYLMFSRPQLFTHEEQQQLREGKQFWEWPSPHGPLAIHYMEKGAGPNHILMIHGFRSHIFTWKELMDPLAQAGYHVWAIDLLGFGLSDKPDANIYNLDFFTEQINAFIDAHGINKAHFIGNSMGGGLALTMALKNPEKVRSLILLSPLGYPLDLPLYISLSRSLSKIWSLFLGPTLVRYGLEQITYHHELITDEQVEAYSIPYRLPGGITASYHTLNNFDNNILISMAEQYPSLKIPSLIIWGDHDTLIPLSHYEHFVQDFPHADKLLIPCCGHIPQEETPDQVTAAILEFLTK